MTLCAAPSEVAELLGVRDIPPLKPRYNIAPSQDVLAVRLPLGETKRQLCLLRWGLIPSWAKDITVGAKMINARAESAAVKPAFRRAFGTRRCLIPADGFYEWQRRGAGKQPYHIRMRDGKPFAFAGLWEEWEGTIAGPIESCTILTTAANDLVAPLHDRMPVIIAPSDFALWLDPKTTDAAALKVLLRPYPSERMVAVPVSTAVNDPAHDDRACTEPVTVTVPPPPAPKRRKRSDTESGQGLLF
jgi:putative SOS response-associated peptidase YedK